MFKAIQEEKAERERDRDQEELLKTDVQHKNRNDISNLL